VHAQTVQQQALLVVLSNCTVWFDTYLKSWSQCCIVLAITITLPPTTDRPAHGRKQLRDVDNGRSVSPQNWLSVRRPDLRFEFWSSVVWNALLCGVEGTPDQSLQPSKLTLIVISVELHRWIWKKASICLYSNRFMTLVRWMCNVVWKPYARFQKWRKCRMWGTVRM
jgi:hypothetical protein